ncbi:PilZ domain-containing protein [Geobacter sp. SVR]|uniref:PilZ domain-containing protein n=1 Tax=Geobacter sp. SVR TaxID=2495594 RepID=UPI00143F04E8|nr:PilZ domain-containing protein [Geobacter sp. SVR]BCS53986.1 pilus protein PilZ [Geobacter sp. SVR]GCF86233.1 pilus protein PilZ [Geobacter sp. SVR]
MSSYYDKVVRGTEHEDMLMLVQFFKDKVGQRFSFLGYYKELPVSYDATLLSVENEMAEFEVHEYQAKVVNIERTVLIHAPEKAPFTEDIFAEAFYVNVAKKRVILCKFAYAKICSGMRRFVRVILDKPLDVDLFVEDDILNGHISDLSLGGAAMTVASCDLLHGGNELNIILKLPDISSGRITEVGVTATVVRIFGESPSFTCYLQFQPEKHSQQQIAYFINQRQVEIIKELKELNS